MNITKTIGVIMLPFLFSSVTLAGPQKTVSVRSRLIGGTWARHLDEKLFFANGTYESHDRVHNKPMHGK